MKTSSSLPSSLLTNRAASNVEHNKSENVSQTRGESEWQKNAIRICGNWSEQLSSKGRVYFYNCITEVSQWQKPSEWVLADINKKELLKIINERRGSDGHSVKRTFSSLTQTERTRSHPRELSSSPKRQKCNIDPSKIVHERLKNENITAPRSDPSTSFRDTCRKVESTGPNSNSSSFKQTADIRQSLGSILDSASITISSVESNRINAPSSRVTDEGSMHSLSSCQNSSSSLSSCRKIMDAVNFCTSRITQSSFRQSTSTNQTAPNFTSQLTALTSLLNTTTAATTTQNFGDASRSNRSPRFGVSSTASSNSRFNHNYPSTMSQSPSPRGSGQTYTDRTSQGDACNRQVSDFVSRLGSFVNHEKDSGSAQGNNTQPPISSKPTNSLLPNPPTINCLPPMHERRHFLQYDRSVRPGPVNPIHRDPGGPQKPNIIRNLVTALNQAVNARRDRNSASTTPGSHRTPPAQTPNHAVVNILTSLLENHKSLNGRPYIEGSSPANKSILNGSTFFRCDIDGKSKSTSEGLLGPPSSDGLSVINSPSCTRTSPHISSPGLCTDSSTDLRQMHPFDFCGGGSSKMLTDQCPTMLLNDQHERITKSFSDKFETEKQKSCASNLILDSPDLLQFVDPTLTSKFKHTVADNLENEAQCEFRKFDRLHSVLYSELSGEQKKLRALVGISETKLKIHQKRKEALQNLMDALETRKPRSSLISSDSGL